jgi:hypothetical protein
MAVSFLVYVSNPLDVSHYWQTKSVQGNTTLLEHTCQ